MEQLTATPSLGFSEAINQATSKIFKFEGRSRRSEYWWVAGAVYLISVFIPPVGAILSLLTIPLTFRRLHDTGRSGWWWGGYALLWGFAFAVFAFDIIRAGINPDTGARLWWIFCVHVFILLSLIFIYKAVLIVVCCLDSEQEENKYGESPKYNPIQYQ